MIDKNKKYTTRSGLPVEIYATDRGGINPVHGAVFNCGAWRPESWTSTGVAIIGRENPIDLVEVKPRIQRTEWFNIYHIGTQGGYRTRELADKYAFTFRIACLEIPIDCEEGEGL